jgi:GntR family transcriptional regulator
VKIDPNDPRPPYRQAADDLRKRISKGEFGPGEKLPSIRALAAEYGVAAQTMQNALRELREAKLVVAQQGRAFFVRDPDRAVTVGEDSERLDAAENQLRDLQERMSGLERDNGDLRALIMDLYSRTGQPYPHADSKGATRREQAG